VATTLSPSYKLATGVASLSGDIEKENVIELNDTPRCHHGKMPSKVDLTTPPSIRRPDAPSMCYSAIKSPKVQEAGRIEVIPCRFEITI
jgi:hypothetical protein